MPARNEKPSASDLDRPPLPRWAFWLMLPGLVGPLLIFGFILFTEAAHREDCPYREIERRPLAPRLEVLEEARNCVAEIEERRFLLLRDGASRLLGERRFERRAFAPEGYRWTAVQTPEGEVQLEVHNAGHETVLFREGTREEHESGTSR
jgi:hypothetical protein